MHRGKSMGFCSNTLLGLCVSRAEDWVGVRTPVNVV